MAVNLESLRKHLINAEIKVNKVFESPSNGDYYPPGWKHNGLSFEQTIKESTKFKNKGKASLNAEELIIANNAALLRSCYGTPDFLLELGNYFIGKYDQDPFYNDYSLLKNEKYSNDDIITLNGSCPEKNGFDIKNWIGKKVWVNPPFSNLSDGAELCNQYSQFDHKPSIAFICNLDYSKYFQECMKYADYLLILGRIQFNPLPGLKNSQPTGSSSMFIYNSEKKNIQTGFLNFKSKGYYIVNLENKSTEKCNEIASFLKNKS